MVGGTTLTLNSNNTYKSETVWSAAGSGCSTYEPKPTWRADTECVRRTVTGAAIYDSVRYQGRSGWFQVGGTSLFPAYWGSIRAGGQCCEHDCWIVSLWSYFVVT